MKPRNTNLRIARLVAVTVVLVSFIIGGAIVLAAYLQASHARHSLEKQVSRRNYFYINYTTC